MELPPPQVFAVLLVVSLPFLVLALRAASYLLPRREPPAFRWKAGEAVAVVAAPFVAVVVLQALFAAPADPGIAAPPAVEGVEEPAPPEEQAEEPGEEAEAEADPPSGATVLLALAASQAVLGAGAALAFLLARRRPGGLAALGLTVGAPLRAFVAIPIVYVPLFFFGAGVTGLWAHLSRALGWPVEQEVMRLILALDGTELALATAVAVLAAPLVEELVFRGFLLGFLVQVSGRAVGFLATALLFALMHGTAGFPTLLSLSLFLCWLQVRTRSIWPSCAAHALNNAVTMGLALLLRAL